MSAYECMTPEDVRRCYRTVYDLRLQFLRTQQNPEFGLCSHVEDPTRQQFCVADAEWKLALPFAAIARYACTNHKDVPFESLRFYHIVDVRTFDINYWMEDERDITDHLLDAQQEQTYLFRRRHPQRVLH